MKYLVVDPSLRSTGLAVVPEGGLEVSETRRLQFRHSKDRNAILQAIYRSFTELLDGPYCRLCFIEGYAFEGPRNSRLAEVGGAIRAALGLCQVPSIDIAPAMWKAASGIPKGVLNMKATTVAGARDYCWAMGKYTGLEHESTDEADACGMWMGINAIMRGEYASDAAIKFRRQVKRILAEHRQEVLRAES